jgi:D-glycero-D-manno-heptose 1,7-bisphosphate phosphatase
LLGAARGAVSDDKKSDEEQRERKEDERKERSNMRNPAQRFVLLDRDGVINRRVLGGYVTTWQQFEFLPRALEALRLLAENGYAALVVSNQACIGKKLLSVADLDVITRRFMTEVALAGGNIIQVYYCTHAPEEACSCRKPQPGLIHRAQLDYGFRPQETFFIGDSPADMEAAASAGCPSILVRRAAFLERREPGDGPPAGPSSLYEAAEVILQWQRGEGGWTPGTMQSAVRARAAQGIHR